MLQHGTETGTDRYNVVCGGYTVQDENFDGVFEPNSMVRVENMKYMNEGGMTLPSGSVATLGPLTGGAVLKSPPVADLGPLAVKQEGLVVGSWDIKLPSVPISENKPHISEVTLTSNFSLIGRQVSLSFVCILKIFFCF